MRRSLCALASLLLVSCFGTSSAPQTVVSSTGGPGSVVSVEHIDTYRSLTLEALVWWVGLSDELPVQHGIDRYLVLYRTTNAAGETVEASGLLALPRNTPPRAVVSYQHGTSSRRVDVPSTPGSQEGLLAGAVFAGHGFVLVAPDYVGLGHSTERHAYLDADTAARNTVDLLRAARSFVESREIEWPEPLFLTGFSQGGQATVATQRKLEREPVDGLRVHGSAPIAGPYQILSISFPHALTGVSGNHSLYLGYISQAYARIHDQPLESIFRDDWAEAVPGLFDGTHGGDVINATLPERSRDLYRAEFLEHYENGGESWYTKALAANELHDWRPDAPLRLYYGELDQDVPPEESRATADHMTRLGADVVAVSVGEVDHDGSVLPAAALARAWFDELLTSHMVSAAAR